MMLICNPNAGYFEFTYFQSEWIEFYLSREIDVFLWNYRGFGKSTGRPSIPNIIEDGKLIVNYLRNDMKVTVLGMHGESLGGCVAIHLANSCECDFLFADRTFGYLSDTIYFNLGRIAYWFFKLSGISDVDSVSPYLKLECYKVIAADPEDALIPDLASLKSAIAARICLKKTIQISSFCVSRKGSDRDYALSFQECKKFCHSLEILIERVEAIITETESDKFQRIFNTEPSEDNDMKGIMSRSLNALNSIDAGGMNLAGVVQHKFPEVQFNLWLMALQVWGTYNIEVTMQHLKGLQKSISSLRTSILQLKSFENTEIFEHIENVIGVFEKCIECLMIRVPRNSMATSRSEDNTGEAQQSTTGFFFPLTCGHSGQYTSMEKETLGTHIVHSKFCLVNEST